MEIIRQFIYILNINNIIEFIRNVIISFIINNKF